MQLNVDSSESWFELDVLVPLASSLMVPIVQRGVGKLLLRMKLIEFFDKFNVIKLWFLDHGS